MSSIKNLLFSTSDTDIKKENYNKLNDKMQISNKVIENSINSKSIVKKNDESVNGKQVVTKEINSNNLIISTCPNGDIKVTSTNYVYTNKKTFDLINIKYIKINKGIYIIQVNEDLKDNEIGLNAKQRNFCQVNLNYMIPIISYSLPEKDFKIINMEVELKFCI